MNPPPVFPDSMDHADLQRARELLPWLATGQLDAAEQAFLNHWLENMMSHHPELVGAWQQEAAAEQAWLHSTRSLLLADARSSQIASTSAQALGLNQLMARIAQSQPRAVPTVNGAINSIALDADNTPATGQKGLINRPNPRAQSRTLPQPFNVFERISQWLVESLGLRGEKLAWALAAVVLVQAGVIGALLHRGSADIEPLSGQQTPTAQATVVLQITVAFKPQATELAMRELLAQVGAQIVNGPSALGLYTVAVPADRADSAIAQLRAATSIVESVQR